MVLFDTSNKTVEDVIQNCTQLIERNATIAGVGNKMNNPLLSVFLGKDAIEHQKEVQSTYFSCWSAEARNQRFTTGCYTREEIAGHIAEASRAGGNYTQQNLLRIVWYWNIMDDDFEKQFECVKQEITGPVGMAIKEIYFIFCSQQDFISQQKTEERLKRLIEWNREKKQPMLVLSDATQQGLLNAHGVTENYHMAASIVLMLNSAPNSMGSNLGLTLDFNMRKNLLWSASYCVCSKNFYDIISVSLLKIIDKYTEMGKSQVSNNEVQARICGEGGNYITFLDDVFEKNIVQKCPNEQQIGFWADLPYTPEMISMENKLSGKTAPQRGGSFFSRLFGRERANDTANVDGVIRSVHDFWEACVNQYYVQPVQEWLASEEGLQKVLDYIYGKLTAVLTLNDMRAQLPKEWPVLERDPIYQNISLAYPEPKENESLPSYLHTCACVELKRQIYGMLLLKIRDIMKELNQNADGFEDMLARVRESIIGRGVDHSIEKAYGNHMNRIIETNPLVLNQKIHPCATEPELLGQMEKAFEALIALDEEHVYYYTLQDDMEFQIQTGTVNPNNVISACFDFDLSTAGRLVTMGSEPGELYCMMNDMLRGLVVNNQQIGKQFIVNRCDRIERLYLYPVRPNTIQYR